MMKYLLPLMAMMTVVLTQACGKTQVPSPEEACHFQQNSYLQRVSWHSLPVRLVAHASLSEAQVGALEEAIEIWNTTRKKEWGVEQNFFELDPTPYTGTEFTQDTLSVVSLASNWDGDSRDQAETVLRWNGNRIVEADVRLNGEKPFSTSETIEAGTIDLVALYVHELGHVLGLLHIESPEYTVMSFELERGTDNRRLPGNLELDALRCEY